MIAKTEAIPIRISAFGGTSQIVTWLTADHGKISTTIKGAQRPKRVGGGQYDLGYLCELLFYEREINGLHIFKDCMALKSRICLRGCWRETAIVSYLCLLAGSGTLSFMQNP
ncbi:MAG: DNA repair protein RecO, partial [Kiritimatiellia bacterium]